MEDYAAVPWQDWVAAGITIIVAFVVMTVFTAMMETMFQGYTTVPGFRSDYREPPCPIHIEVRKPDPRYVVLAPEDEMDRVFDITPYEGHVHAEVHGARDEDPSDRAG